MTRNRKTCHRYNAPGDAHALTFSCSRRQAFLNADRTRQWLVDANREAVAKHRYHVCAYVVMPEHVHLLVWPTEHYRFWQRGGGYDRNLTEPTTIWSDPGAPGHTNPVRRGLCERAVGLIA